MKNMGLMSACKIRVNVLDLGIISVVPKSKSKRHHMELVHQVKNSEGKKIQELMAEPWRRSLIMVWKEEVIFFSCPETSLSD